MSAIQTQYRTREREMQGEKVSIIEAYNETQNCKLVETRQICIHCGRAFPPKRGRKRCPCCGSLLRNTTLVVQHP